MVQEQVLIQMACLIFDVDDTLVDSETLCNQAYLDLVPEIDVSVEQMVSLFRARKLSEILAEIEVRFKCTLGEAFEPRYRAHVKQLFRDGLREVRGVSGALQAISAPMGVASNGPRAKIDDALGITGLDRFFGENIFSAYDINSWKPAPELFLHAARQMGFAPDQCVVIEDSDVGVSAGLAAGMRVLHYCAEGQSEPREGVIVFDNMAMLPQLVEELI